MAGPGTINHDTAARLVGVTPGELEALVKAGAVRRSARDAYVLPVLVQDYIGHVKALQDRVEMAPNQAEIAEHLDLSDRSVREFLAAVGIDHKAETLSRLRVAYIRNLREVAAGRQAEGGVDLAAERARLAAEQADKIAMQNAVTRKELSPTYLLEEILASAGARVAQILDAIPGAIRRRNQNLTADDIASIAVEIAKARNIAAAIRLEDVEIDADDQSAVAPAGIAEPA